MLQYITSTSSSFVSHGQSLIGGDGEHKFFLQNDRCTPTPWLEIFQIHITGVSAVDTG